MLEDGAHRANGLSLEQQTHLQLLLADLPQNKRFNHEKYFRNDPLFDLYFVSESSEIRYCLGIGRWRQMPYFSLLDFRNTLSDTPFRRRDRKLINSLFSTAFVDLHSEGKFTFVYATRVRPFPVRHLKSSGVLAPVRGVPIFDRYDFAIEAEVPIGGVPQFPYQEALIRLMSRSFDYWIKRGTLKLSYMAEYLPSLAKEKP
ncbi:MAG: hypothetical protein J0L82_06280 [Deltaproteobacteria bacterium]|nr:hypothetical protein [Deltaproteobacteria bacterium]